MLCKIIVVLGFLMAFNCLYQANAKCTRHIPCLNGGHFNKNSCKCDCLANYVGVNCQLLNCRFDSDECTLLKQNNCDNSNEVKYYCPFKCGLCKANERQINPNSRFFK